MLVFIILNKVQSKWEKRENDTEIDLKVISSSINYERERRRIRKAFWCLYSFSRVAVHNLIFLPMSL